MPASSTRLLWPMLFTLQRSTLELLEHADYVYDFERDIEADGESVMSQFFDDSLKSHVTGLRGFDWQRRPGEFTGAVIDEGFDYMSLRMSTVAYVPGSRLAMSIDRCSLPLGRQMLQVMDAAPRGDRRRCRFRWRIAVRYLPGMSILAPAVTPAFRRMFEQTLDAVQRRCAVARQLETPRAPDVPASIS
jgi:hypothetical protein